MAAAPDPRPRLVVLALDACDAGLVRELAGQGRCPNLARLLVTFPLVNLKTVAMIHWQGVKLWLRGVKFRANPNRSGIKKRRQLWPRGH